IFGEVMLLIEPDKRTPEWAVKLTYEKSSEQRFYVPPNVYLLGMMNTADRSISMVDYALRRRFAFVTLTPQFESERFRVSLQRRGMSAKLIDAVVSGMTALNEAIASDAANLGRGFCIGHSFFTSMREGTSPEDWY